MSTLSVSQAATRPTSDGRAATTVRHAAPFLLIYTSLVSAAIGNGLGGWWVLLPMVVLYALLPTIDHILGTSHDNPFPDAPPASARLHDAVIFSYVPAQVAFVLWALGNIIASTGPWYEQAMAVINVGLVTGATGITIAHELMHRRTKLERAMAEILMTLTTYTWFCVEHVHGHHRHVSTPNDPATSRFGESLYAFLPRTFVGGLLNAIAIERKRIAKRKLPVLSLDNRMVRYPLVILAAYAIVFSVFGWIGVALFAAQSAVGILMLEIINYVEHYGLTRTKLSDGRYERVQPQHSWNASHRVSNWILVNLARHSDHHAYASRPFHALRHHDDVPQMPTGYSGMFLLALVPPLWFSVMNPRVEAWRARYIKATEATPQA